MGAAGGRVLTTNRQRAINEQLDASNPNISAFVEASAGSGKTKLLTDRILRLMLAGADPGRIQCLTFTKAAAAEMALRLQNRLGTWATVDNQTLDKELGDLLVPAQQQVRETARQLFARVLDLPGGMRIGTIHAFCQSLLRRFPLEAAVTPHFQLVEDADARMTMEGAREGVLAGAPDTALRELAGLATAAQLGDLVQTLDQQRDRLAKLMTMTEDGLAEAVRRTAGAPPGTEAELLAAAVNWQGEREVRQVLEVALARASPGVKRTAAELLDWLAQPDGARVRSWADWTCLLLNKDGTPSPLKDFANDKLAALHPEIRDVIQAEQTRVIALQERRRTLQMAEATTGLLLLALPVLRAYAARKAEAGLLDYTDLIGLTAGLLRDPGAAWVLYKLDGGIDHILLDEVQDTAPEQWRIAHRLTEEFFAGLGARVEDGAPHRSFFAVGDPKQSIYSFQGADPDEFKRSRAQMAARVGNSGKEWREVTLDVSFRSTQPVLALVDAVFADDQAKNGVADEHKLQHFADRVGDAGRVELWPLVPVPETPDIEPWTVPAQNRTLRSARQRVADGVASWIAAEIARGPVMSSKSRPLEAGDVMVLVRRRDEFATSLVRALKAKGVPVAGLDRLELIEQAAVQDLLAACDAVLLPEDDLAVACVLTSPLGGLSDDSLMELALGRRGRLWNALRDRAAERPDWTAAWRFLSALQARADHVTPHALLAEALGPLGGRPRLLARLGPEAAEPLDELLNAALAYTALHAPSLQGFVHWLRRSGATVKREAGGAGGTVRVMTVHGAKGLQAPLVLLPDTTGLPPEDEKLAWSTDPATHAPLPLWAPRKEFRCAAVDRARQEERARQVREYNRLLYVALTRAEDRLVICGWDMKRGVPDTSWYRMVERGFAALGATPEPFTLGWGETMLAYATPQTRPLPDSKPATGDASAELPAWAGRPGDWRPAPPPPEPATPIPLAPSRPTDAHFGPVPRAASPLRAETGRRFLRGSLVHELLQHLPALGPERWDRAARAHLARHGLDPAEVETLAEQALAVLRHPELAPLFGPAGRAEQPMTGLIRGVVVSGTVDRMAVLPGEVLLADYKTGRDAPEDVTRTPVMYLRQLAAYRAVVQSIYPDRTVRCALVWTSGPAVVSLPSALLDAHAPGA